jgi:Arc/MetJ-type ribon-helix-helix transcriptional regulator
MPKTVQSKNGRRTTDADPLISVRLPPETIRAIDRWAKRDEITRSEAIRRLLKGAPYGLQGRGETQGDAAIDSRRAAFKPRQPLSAITLAFGRCVPGVDRLTKVLGLVQTEAQASWQNV